MTVEKVLENQKVLLANQERLPRGEVEIVVG